jgi:hypothetical protein
VATDPEEVLVEADLVDAQQLAPDHQHDALPRVLRDGGHPSLPGSGPVRLRQA